MKRTISRLLEAYESGKMSRRDLVQGLTLMAAGAKAASAAGFQGNNLAAFGPTPAGAGRPGNSGVGICEGPGTITVAGGLAKSFALREKLRVRFEATFTNILNHPNFLAPPTDVSSPNTFGVTETVQSSENGGNRVGQLSLRLDF